MNTAIKSIILAVSTVAASGAFAAEAYPDTWISEARSVASRQDVSAQAIAARAAGDIEVGEVSGLKAAKPVASTLTRAQVSAEAAMALRQGLIKVGEVS